MIVTSAGLAWESGRPHWAVIKKARQRQRRRRQRLMAILAAAVMAAGGWVLGTQHASSPRPSSVGQPSSVVIPGADLDGTPVAAAAAGRALWVLTCVRHCSGIQRSSGELLQIATGSGLVIKRFPVADPQALAISDGAIWIAHFVTGTVTRVDPADGRTTATIRLTLPGPKIEGGHLFLPSNISAGGGRIWVTTVRGWLAVIDAGTSRLAAMLPTPAESSGQAAADSHGTWVTEQLAGVGFIAPGAHRLTIRPISRAGQNVDVSGVAAGGGLVWAYGSSYGPGSSRGRPGTSVVTVIDPQTSNIVRQLQVAGPDNSFTYGNGALYVADFQRGLVFRIPPDLSIQALHVPRGSGVVVAATGGSLWVTTQSGRLLRILIPRQ